ncbi:MAG TPA: DUF4837 family protein [Draconibacterium sp.]|nr:DUF4837 family protein [Draconibacterium sp.]
MKSRFYTSLVSFFLILGMISCSDSGTERYKNITGKAGEMVVVMSKESWNSAPGKLVRETLAQPQLALPQDEPIFDLINIPQAAFTSVFQSTRNIIRTSISTNVDKEGITYNDDIWAYPQATVQITAKTPEQFVKLFSENKNKIVSYFLKAERERLTMSYEKYYEKTVYNVLNKDFNLTVKVPPGFVIADEKKDFIWFKYETPEISQGIILYDFPYVSDSAFQIGYQLKVRDSVLEANVPGPTDGSYMTTERRINQVNNFFEHNGNYAGLMRGLWKVQNDFMGGPYVSLAELDASEQRVVVAFGYVYAPGKKKRNLLNQVQAMIYSMKFNNQAENDKINSQAKMGN